MRTYRCVICGNSVSYQGPLPAAFPFCSRRCRLVDLDRWFREAYTLDRELRPEELDGGGEPAPDRDPGE